jgi:hypothetical protein
MILSLAIFGCAQTSGMGAWLFESQGYAPTERSDFYERAGYDDPRIRQVTVVVADFGVQPRCSELAVELSGLHHWSLQAVADGTVPRADGLYHIERWFRYGDGPTEIRYAEPVGSANLGGEDPDYGIVDLSEDEGWFYVQSLYFEFGVPLDRCR